MRGAARGTRVDRRLPLAGLPLLASLVLLPVEAAPERPRSVEVGPVSAGASGAGPEALEALRSELEDAARAMGRARPGGARLLLSGAVTRLEQERRGARLRLRCEVSVLVLEAPGGSLRVLLTGRASSEGGVPRSRAELDGLERGLVSDAARSAIGRLSSVIDRI